MDAPRKVFNEYQFFTCPLSNFSKLLSVALRMKHVAYLGGNKSLLVPARRLVPAGQAALAASQPRQDTRLVPGETSARRPRPQNGLLYDAPALLDCMQWWLSALLPLAGPVFGWLACERCRLAATDGGATQGRLKTAMFAAHSRRPGLRRLNRQLKADSTRRSPPDKQELFSPLLHARLRSMCVSRMTKCLGTPRSYSHSVLTLMRRKPFVK